MSIIDIRTCYAINYPLGNNAGRETLILGNNRMIYLYFNLPPFCSLYTFTKAEIILFQYPCAPWSRVLLSDNRSGSDSYALFPMLKPLNIYYRLAPIDIDYARCIAFQVSRQQSYAAIDITNILQDWMNGKLGNSGLLLTGSAVSQDVAFASGQFALPWMRPMLRLTCECKELQPALCRVPCDVKVTNSFQKNV